MAGVNMGMDGNEAFALSGFMKEVGLKIGTPVHVVPVLKYVHAEMKRDFVKHMETTSRNRPSEFHHVYEWGQIGNPRARLWEDVLQGNSSVRTATFKWKASKSIVPVRDDFAEAGVREIHVFVWKAPIMEYSTDITISPKNGGRMAYFTGPTNPTDKYEMKFTQPGQSLTIADPGGVAVKGAFTAEYVSWWSGGGGAATFNSRVRAIVEQNTGTAMTKGIKSGTRSRTRSFGMKTMGNAAAAEAQGKAAAMEMLAGLDRDWLERAAIREDGDV